MVCWVALRTLAFPPPSKVCPQGPTSATMQHLPLCVITMPPSTKRREEKRGQCVRGGASCTRVIASSRTKLQQSHTNTPASARAHTRTRARAQPPFSRRAASSFGHLLRQRSVAGLCELALKETGVPCDVVGSAGSARRRRAQSRRRGACAHHNEIRMRASSARHAESHANIFPPRGPGEEVAEVPCPPLLLSQLPKEHGVRCCVHRRHCRRLRTTPF